ncbi:MAG: dihydrolipoyl dehydrogenase [Parachlamydiales bacterium]|jgi:dihydrolipoamide dehydrogenase
MTYKNYDLAIIGAGPGGYTAAIRAAQLGFKVALIEKSHVGGVCLNQGCIPTKALLSCSDNLDLIKKASFFGISIESFSFDLTKMIERKDSIVQNLRSSLKNLILSNKVDIIEGSANFIDQNTIHVQDQDISAKNIIIATGSYINQLPNIQMDHENVFDSTSILNLKKLPKSIAIVGGGYIGCEFASFFARLNVKVTIIESMEAILFQYTKSISDFLSRSFKNNGIDIKTKAKILNLEKNNDGIKIKLDTNEEIDAQIALIAVGRRPNTQDLNLEKINIKTGKSKEIVVDEKMRTSIPNIYAIGDVVGKYMLAHTASHEAIVAVDTIAGIENTMSYSAVPFVIFTKPEIASVGISEEKAKELNIDADIGKFPFSALGKSFALNEREGWVKVIFDKKTKLILGAESTGYASSILIAQMALAITNRLTAESIIKTIHAHPTLPESWHEAALISQNRPINFPPNLKI